MCPSLSAGRAETGLSLRAFPFLHIGIKRTLEGAHVDATYGDQAIRTSTERLTNPILQVLCDIRPLQTLRDINDRLAKAGVDFTIQDLEKRWPESLPRFCMFRSRDDTIQFVVFNDLNQHVTLDGVASGEDLGAMVKRFPAAEHVRQTRRDDGTLVDTYVLNPGDVVRHEVSIVDDRVTFQFFNVDMNSPGYKEIRRQTEQAAKEAYSKSYREEWAARTHGFAARGDLDDQLRTWASNYDGDFHGNDWTRLADWLIDRSSPADRHAFVQAYNWDHGATPLAWIAAQPDTSLATLGEIFWLAEPHHFEDHRINPKSPIDTDVFDLLWDLRDIARQRASKTVEVAAPAFAFDPGPHAAAFASDDPQSFFAPVFCHPVPGEVTSMSSKRWPIPIN